MLFPVFIFSCVLFARKRMLRYLRYLQQEGYDSRRFVNWMIKEKAFDKRGFLAISVVALLSQLTINVYLLVALFLTAISFWEIDPRNQGKIKLNMTERARRIYFLACALYLTFQMPLLFLENLWFFPLQIILFQLIPFCLLISLSILSFDEQKRQWRFIKEGKDRLKEVSPFVIGITGSYGKTSTKNALATLLQITKGSTFWPAKGVNTEMGITREIRDHLKKGTEYAVIEMGAYGKGSIEKLCRLTPPDAGIITTIGLAHLERFGNQETIKFAKSELAQAIPKNGILVCNGDNPGSRSISEEHRKTTTLLYGFDNRKNDLDCWITRIEMTSSGTLFTFKWKEMHYSGNTPLLGKSAISNLAASFTMACALGAEPDFVIAACAHVLPVDNRLQIHRERDVTYLRDAYNSNPEGFSDALDVLQHLEGKRKILMTPGMIELAELNHKLHEKIGIKAANVCDQAILVGNLNRESLTQGLLNGGMHKESILHVENRKEAFECLQKHVQPGDIVLIENDLPDVHEAKEKF